MASGLTYALGTLLVAIALATGVWLVRWLAESVWLQEFGAAWLGAIAPRYFAFVTFVGGTILLVSGATPTAADRLGWVRDFLPLPIIEVSAYFASIAGIGLILLARGLQQRLGVAYHATVWLLVGGIVFSLTSALDITQAVALTAMLLVLLPNRRFFYRKASVLEERFTTGWILAIAAVLLATLAVVFAHYGADALGSDVFWRFHGRAQGPRAVRGFILAALALAVFAALRLVRPARVTPEEPSVDDLAEARRIVHACPHASSHLVLLGDKQLLFDDDHMAFIMYGVAGRSWVAMGDPVGPQARAAALVDRFVAMAHHAGGWAVFYRARPDMLPLYLDYAFSVVKLGEIAVVPLADFSLDGPARRNLRRTWRRAVDDGCTFHVLDAPALDAAMPELSRVSEAWLRDKRTREKGFSMGRFDPEFVRDTTVGVVRQADRIVAFVTLWPAGGRAEVEVDLMRYVVDAPPGIMRYALIEAMFWARAEGYARFNLGMAPLSGIRASAATPVWNQIMLAVRGAGERYYNFQGLREFKEWFHPQWEPRYLVSPGGARRPVVVANIASLVSGSLRGTFVK